MQAEHVVPALVGGELLAELEQARAAREDEEDAGVGLLGEAGGELLAAVVEALHDALAARPQLLGAHLRAPLRRHQQVLQREAALLVRLVAPLQRADEVPREHAQLAVHLLLEPDELGADGADQLLGAAAAAAHHLAAHGPRGGAAQLVQEDLGGGAGAGAQSCFG